MPGDSACFDIQPCVLAGGICLCPSISGPRTWNIFNFERAWSHCCFEFPRVGLCLHQGNVSQLWKPHMPGGSVCFDIQWIILTRDLFCLPCPAPWYTTTSICDPIEGRRSYLLWQRDSQCYKHQVHKQHSYRSRHMSLFWQPELLKAWHGSYWDPIYLVMTGDWVRGDNSSFWILSPLSIFTLVKHPPFPNLR